MRKCARVWRGACFFFERTTPGVWITFSDQTWVVRNTDSLLVCALPSGQGARINGALVSVITVLWIKLARACDVVAFPHATQVWALTCHQFITAHTGGFKTRVFCAAVAVIAYGAVMLAYVSVLIAYIEGTPKAVVTLRVVHTRHGKRGKRQKQQNGVSFIRFYGYSHSVSNQVSKQVSFFSLSYFFPLSFFFSFGVFLPSNVTK